LIFAPEYIVLILTRHKQNSCKNQGFKPAMHGRHFHLGR